MGKLPAPAILTTVFCAARGTITHVLRVTAGQLFQGVEQSHVERRNQGKHFGTTASLHPDAGTDFLSLKIPTAVTGTSEKLLHAPADVIDASKKLLQLPADATGTLKKLLKIPPDHVGTCF